MAEAAELIAYASQPAFVVDGRQKVLAFNPAAEELLDHSPEEAMALTCDQLLRAVQPDGGAMCCGQCEGIIGLRACRPYANGHCFVQRKDGSHVSVAVNTIAMPGNPLDFDRPVAIIFISTADSASVTEVENDTRLHIHTLGRFAISLRGCCLPMEQWPRKQAVQLLKFLAAHADRPLHRERLIEHLWPDADEQSGWARLKVTVHFLRQRLRERGFLQDVIMTTDSSYLLRQDCVWIDSAAFEALAREGRAQQRAGAVADAIHSFDEARRLYRGDFMEADLYADWCAEDRERFSELYIESLNALAELHFARGEYAAAAQDCHTALVREPCRESVHRLLMQSLIALHRPESAVRQYHRCERTLKTELGVLPAAETVAVVASLLGSGSAAPSHMHPRRSTPH